MDEPRENDAPAEGASADREDLLEFLSGYLRIVRFLRLYPDTHPLIAEASAELGAEWRLVRERWQEISLEARTATVLLDGAEVVRFPKALRPLVDLLEARNLEAVAIATVAEFDELVDLAEILALPRDEVMEGGAIKPHRVAALSNIHLIAAGASAALGLARSFPTGGEATSPTLPRILASALPKSALPKSALPEGGPVTIGDGWPPVATGPTMSAASAGPAALMPELAAALLNDPDRLAPQLAANVCTILRPNENPTSDDMLDAFSQCLEPLLTERIEQSADGFSGAERTLKNVFESFDSSFTRRILPDGPDGRPSVDNVLRRFSSRFKLKVLEHELLDERTDRNRLRELVDVFSASDAEEDQLLLELARSVTEDPRFRAGKARIARTLALGPGQRRRRALVLVLEADPTAARRLKTRLGSDRRDVRVFGHSAQFLDEVRERDPDLVVVDPRIRGVDGLGLIAQLRRMGRKGDPIPLVVISDEASFRREFEISTYPGCRFVLKDDGLEAIEEQVNLELCAGHDEPDLEPGPGGASHYRPARAIANRHFFVPDYEVLTFHRADVDGSVVFFDAVQVDEQRTCVLIADGFAVPSDAVEWSTCTTIRSKMETLLREGADPHHLTCELNALLHERVGGSRLIRSLALDLDAARGIIVGCSAGGLRPLVVAPDGSSEDLDMPSGLVLGFSPNRRFEPGVEAVELTIEPGHTLFAYSLGVAEALGEGDATLALPVIRQETAFAFHQCGRNSSPLEAALGRIWSAVQHAPKAAADKAAIWIRRIDSDAPAAARE